MPRPPGTSGIPAMPNLPGLPRAAVGSAGAGASATQAVPADTILQLARPHIGEPYVLGARVPMSNGDWHGPWDCAEFCSWCVFQASGILFGVEPRHDPMRADAYTGYWAEQARQAGAVISVEKAAGIAGALLLREPQTSRAGHIVFSDGAGGTVEAHSHNRGVIAGEAGGRRWDIGILVPGIRYFASTEAVSLAPPPANVLRLTDPMMRGESVRALQQCLADLGYFPGKTDGVYGPQTESAVCAFQAAQGLLADGEFGPDTRAAMKRQKACAKRL